MSSLSKGRARRFKQRGGATGYPLAQLHEEVAIIALNFHWSLEEILNLEHRDRRLWVAQIFKQKGNTASM
ncbi:DUF6760 family protein [Baaleninema simplex]|uniref:DUF6760 family protein n=1 Tax=Baaleninema simplex TaxID=2862350 RepID=UPI0008FBDC74